MALEEKLAKSAKKSASKSKEKTEKKEPEGGGRHAVIEKHSKGGYSAEFHEHGRHEICEGDCDSSAHNSMGGAMKAVRGHFEGSLGDEDEGEMGEKD